MADYDFSLSDGKGTTWKIILDGGASAIRQRIISEDAGAVTMTNQGTRKKVGDFDEQSDWKAGHGHDNFSDQPNGFYNAGKGAWTLNKNIVHNGLQWQFADGLRNNDTIPYGSFKWFRLATTGGHAPYLSTDFTASASYNSKKVPLWIRRVGTPGILTLTLCADSSGSPGTALKVSTLAASSVSENISVLNDFLLSSVQALVSGTKYHIKLTCASGNKDNYWEIATDASGAKTGKISANGSTWTAWAYGMFLRVCDTDAERRIWLFQYQGIVYAITKNDDGTAGKLFVNGDRGKATAGGATTLTNTNKTWVTDNFIGAYVKIISGKGKGQVRVISSNTTTQLTVSTWSINPDSTSEYIIYKTRAFTEISISGGVSIADISGKPVVLNGIVYIPQTAGNYIIRMRYNPAASPPAHEFAYDGTNQGELLTTADDASAGGVIWRALGGSVARAPKVAWGVNLTFTVVTLSGSGSPDYNDVTGITYGNGKTWVAKEGDGWSVSGLTPTRENWDFGSTPSILNGKAIIFAGGKLYLSRLHSVLRIYGGSADDIGISWRGTELPEEKLGNFAAFEYAIGWLFAAVDGKSTSTSGVRVYDGMYWHEIFDAYAVGKRVRDILWQPMEDTYYRLWIDIGEDLVYIDFPPYTNVPSQSSTARYMHESIIVSSTIDMGTSARLPKFLRSIATLTKNLGDGKYIGIDYQVDDYIGTSTWIPLNPISTSPNDETIVNGASIRKFRYRLRLNTNSNTTPIILLAITPNGYARVPFQRAWDVRVKGLSKSGLPGDPGKMSRWLLETSRTAGPILMRSKKYPELDNVWVVVTPPNTIFERPKSNGAKEQESFLLTIQEMI